MLVAKRYEFGDLFNIQRNIGNSRNCFFGSVLRFKHLNAKRMVDSNYVKDVTSKTFMVLIKKWQQLNIKDQQGYLKYLYRVAKNKIREYYREFRRVPLSLDDPESDGYKQYHAKTWYPEQDIDEQERFMDLATKLQKELPESDQDLFNLVVIKQIPKKDIAELYQITPSAFSKRWKKISNDLEKCLDKYGI